MTQGVWESDANEGSIVPSFDIRRSFVREAATCLQRVSVLTADGTDTTARILFNYTAAPGNEGARACFEEGSLPVFENMSAPPVLASVSMYGKDGLANAASLTYMSGSSGTPKTFLRSVTGMKTGRYEFD